MKWTEISAGQVNRAEQRLRVAWGDDAHRVVSLINSDQQYVDQIARFAIQVAIRQGFIESRYQVVVNCNCSLEELIAEGSYDWVNSNITQKHFPVSGQNQEEEIVLFCFNKVIGSNEAIGKMDEAGFRPATSTEGISLGNAHPDLQREFSIICLGDPWLGLRGHRHVVYLGRSGSRRDLSLSGFEADWRERCRFVAVRK